MIYNFSAGPACLPDSVLKIASEAAVNYRNNGMSILEMSHRSAPVVELFNETGETINGINSQDSIACNFIKSQAYAPHHHRDTSGVRVRRSNVTVPYTLLDYETAVMDQNRQIKAVKPEHINTVAQAFISTMS